MLFPVGMIHEVKKLKSIPDQEWAEQAVEALSLFDMERDFPSGTWEHVYYTEMLESRIVGIQNCVNS